MSRVFRPGSFWDRPDTAADVDFVLWVDHDVDACVAAAGLVHPLWSTDADEPVLRTSATDLDDVLGIAGVAALTAVGRQAGLPTDVLIPVNEWAVGVWLDGDDVEVSWRFTPSESWVLPGETGVA